MPVNPSSTLGRVSLLGVPGFDVATNLLVDSPRGDRRNRRKAITANDAVYAQAA